MEVEYVRIWGQAQCLLKFFDSLPQLVLLIIMNTLIMVIVTKRASLFGTATGG
jgi:hypothetical protein